MKRMTIRGLLAIGAAGLGCTLGACNDTSESTNKSTTTKVSETPEGTKVTTEKVEKKVETETKKP